MHDERETKRLCVDVCASIRDGGFIIGIPPHFFSVLFVRVYWRSSTGCAPAFGRVAKCHLSKEKKTLRSALAPHPDVILEKGDIAVTVGVIGVAITFSDSNFAVSSALSCPRPFVPSVHHSTSAHAERQQAGRIVASGRVLLPVEHELCRGAKRAEGLDDRILDDRAGLHCEAHQGRETALAKVIYLPVP